MTLRDTLKQLLEAAQRFERKTPQYKRIEVERQALRETMTQAQLILSVPEPAQEKEKSAGRLLRSVPDGRSRKTRK
jgi:hypothetical protein